MEVHIVVGGGSGGSAAGGSGSNGGGTGGSASSGAPSAAAQPSAGLPRAEGPPATIPNPFYAPDLAESMRRVLERHGVPDSEEAKMALLGEMMQAAMHLGYVRPSDLEEVLGPGTSGPAATAGAAAGSSVRPHSQPQPQPQSEAQPAAQASSGSVPGGAAEGVRCCAYCGISTVRRLRRCGGCKQVYYCSVDCSHDAWPQHKQRCRELRRLQADRGN